jgi:hypothetical protein
VAEIKKESDPLNFPVEVDEAKLAQTLDPLSYEVLRHGATERPFTGEYNETDTVRKLSLQGLR